MKRLLLLALALLGPLASEEIVQTAHENGSFSYTATVGSLPVRKGEEQTADIFYIFYRKAGAEARRPITFCFNGGPGCSSVWLHMQAFGPKRVLSPEEGQSLAPPYQLIENADSILDLTDLVFVDPVGTGLSRPKGEGSSFYDMDGDIESLGDFIYDFVTREGRWNSPKYLAGESYGGLRVCGLSNYLLSRHYLFLNGVILIAPAIDYQTFRCNRDKELAYALYLPSFAATAWYHGRLPHLSLEEVVFYAREFALGTFGAELLKNGSLPERLYEEVAAWTGLPLHVVRQERGLISEGTFFNHFGASQNKSIGRFDSRWSGERLPGSSRFEFFDPSFVRVFGLATAALHDYLYYDLNYKAEWPRYEILSHDVNRQWNFDCSGFPNQLEALRQALLTNPEMRVFAACGYFDLAIPFATVEHCLKRLHLPSAQVSLGYYEGGHMFYTNPAALRQFKMDLQKFYTR